MIMIRPIRNSLSELNLIRRGVGKFKDTNIEDFKTYDSKKLLNIKNQIKDYIDKIDYNFHHVKGLFCFGTNGTGKTFLTSLIVKEAYRHRYTSRRITFVEYVREYTRLWDLHGEERDIAEELFYNDIKAVEFLVLDEVGKEVNSKIAEPILEDLLRYREDHRLPTIIVTNFSLDSLKERYGNSIYSLIKGGCEPLKFEGTDRRAVKNEE